MTRFLAGGVARPEFRLSCREIRRRDLDLVADFSALARCLVGEHFVEIGARHLERVSVTGGALLREVVVRIRAIAHERGAVLELNAPACTASSIPASSINCMLFASRLSPIEKRGNCWRSRISTS